MAIFNGKEGVWRTVGGRRIFIANGEDLKTAMKRSGKFKRLNEFDKKYEIIVDDFYREWNEKGHGFNSKEEWGEHKRLSVRDKKNGEIIASLKWKEVTDFTKTGMKDRINVVAITVKEGYRRQGIATRLYKELQKIAGDEEIYFGELSSDGKKLIKKIGKITKSRNNHYWGKINK